ncbi:helix-turn-helix domain-containing protein [Oscillospiraceae bacterium 42-9]
MFKIRLKELREEKGMNQREFAAALGVSPATVGMWESGAREPRSFEQLQRIADYFAVSTDYLLGITPFGRTFVFDDESQIDKDLDWADHPQSKVEKNKAPIPEAAPSLDQQLSDIDFALSGEIHDLTDNEKQDILDYIRFKKSQRGGGDK